MKLTIQDQHGNLLGVNGFSPSTFPVDIREVESSRLEGLDVKLSDDSESIVLTLTVEEV